MLEEGGTEYLLEKFNEGPEAKIEITYLNGKLVASDELDKAILNNFKTCTSKDIFLDDEDED